MGRRKLPPIPSQIYSQLGPVPVTLEKIEGDDSGMVFGKTSFNDRTITLNSDVSSKEALWATFWHELAHVVLFDSGIHNQLTSEAEETLCDAFGTYLASAMKAGFINIPSK